MPSKDRIDPKANEWMEREGIVCQGAAAATPKARKPERKMSAQIERLARRIGTSPDELAKKIPADTIRRSKYPVIEHRNPDGTRTFEHDLGISEGPVSRRS